MSVEQLDIFSQPLRRYPADPGVKAKSDTTTEAAKAMRGRAVVLRLMVLQALGVKPMTADECANALCESVLAVRPRFSELLARGMIEETEERHRNLSGKSAIVWRIRTETFPTTNQTHETTQG
jgi:predicted ArsR family transcriptional regulator